MTITVDEATKELLARDRESADKSRAEAFEKLARGRPTPTQEECDASKAGVAIWEHEDDGSGPEIHPLLAHRSMGAAPAKPAGSYQTRQASSRASGSGSGSSHSG